MKPIYYAMCMATLFVIATGCTASRVEMDYGTSYRLAIANQTLNPGAAKNLEPVAGLEGPAAQKAHERYIKGFEKQEPQPTYLLNVGSSASK